MCVCVGVRVWVGVLPPIDPMEVCWCAAVSAGLFMGVEEEVVHRIKELDNPVADTRVSGEEVDCLGEFGRGGGVYGEVVEEMEELLEEVVGEGGAEVNQDKRHVGLRDTAWVPGGGG